jgi:lysine 2,3-aminomutase
VKNEDIDMVEKQDKLLKGTIVTAKQLSRFICLTEDEIRSIEERRNSFPMKITGHYAQLLHKTDPNDPLRRIAVPSSQELIKYPDDDEIDVHSDEAKYQPVEGIIHRYPGKLLLIPTLRCIGHCRFCFRSGKEISTLEEDKIEQALEYIRQRKDVRDVTITGGDPLVLERSRFEYILSELRSIDHIEIIRIGTHAPVYMPQLIDCEFVNMVAKYKPVVMTVSFLHPREITPEACEALELLSDSGVVLLQQGPILKGINDNTDVLKELYEKLAKHRVIAYYAIWGIFAPGIRHFAIDGHRARELILGLENRTSGFCVPHLITLDQENNKDRTLG